MNTVVKKHTQKSIDHYVVLFALLSGHGRLVR